MNGNWLETLIDLPPLADAILKTSVLLAAGWLIHWGIRRRNPRWRVLLWRSVATGMVVLPLLGFILPEMSLPVVPQPIEDSREYVSYNPSPILIGMAGRAPTMGFGGASVAAPRPSRFEVLKADVVEWIRLHPFDLLLAAWFAIVAILAVAAARSGRRFRRIAAKARPAPAPVCRAMQQVSGKMGWKRPVALLVTSEIASPVLVGVRRPTILLPKSALAPNRQGDLTAIFAHEISHLKSSDLIWSRIIQSLSILLWFHPLAWWIRGAHASACEEVSDAVAADFVGDRAAYSGTLARVALALVRRRQPLGGIPMARRSQIRERLAILNKKIRALPIRKRWIVASLSVGFVALAVLGGLKLTYAQNNPDAEEAGESGTEKAARILHFPKNRFMGQVWIRDADDPNEEGYLREGGFDRHWALLADAQGDVSIPAGKQVYLHMYKPVNLTDLSPLAALRPDDLSMLSIACDGMTRADAAIMPYVGRLTGLKALDLRHVCITARGVQHLKNLKSLTHLKIMPEAVLNPRAASRQLADDCLPIIAGMESLTDLTLNSRDITDPGLEALTRMKSLRRLSIWSPQIRGGGLARLSGLPSLEHLSVRGQSITDGSLRYVAAVSQIKSLDLGGAPITDKGLAHLSGMTGLEELNLYNTHVTEKGMVHLSPLTSLKRLTLGKGPGNPTKVGEGALLPLRSIRSFEYLDFSNCALTDEDLASLAGCTKLRFFCCDSSRQTPISDAGLAHLAALPALEELRIGGGAIGDAGMKHLANLKGLKVLSLRHAPGLTNAALANLRPLTSLRLLDISRSEEITVGGLSQLNGLTALEELRVRGLKRDGEILGLSNLKQLKNLTITSGKEAAIADEDLACLRDLPNLEEIQIGPHGLLSDKGLEHLAGLTNLTMLNIGGPYITDDGLQYLSKLENLFHLTLTGNFGDAGLRHLESLRRLNYLTLVSGQNISQGAQAQLRARLPRLLNLVANQDREIRWDVMPPKAGDRAPALHVETIDGNTFDLSKHAGEALLLHFWGTWCPPCVASTPALKEFYEALSRHKNFAMISLSMDDYEEPLRRHLAEHKIAWPQARIGLKSKISAGYGVNDRAPIFILVGPDGRILLQDERDWKKIAAVVDETLGAPEAKDAKGASKDLRATETVGPEPVNGRHAAVRLPDLDAGGEGSVLDLARGARSDASAANMRELENQEKGDLAYRYSGGEPALVCLRGASLRQWSEGRLASPSPDARRGPVSVYFLKTVPCQCRVTTSEGDEYEVRILAADERGAQVEFWKSDGRTTVRESPNKSPAWLASDESTSAAVPAPERRIPGRVLHFPGDRSVGRLYVQDVATVREIRSYYYWTDDGSEWGYLGEARGDVDIPAGARVRLITNSGATKGSAPLDRLHADDLYELIVSYGRPDEPRPGDDFMAGARHLTGLKSLGLEYTNIGDAGIRHVRGLTQLEFLSLPPRITDRGLESVAALPALKGLYFKETRCTNSGIAAITKLKTLEELALGGERIGDPALAHLAKLPNLEYLMLWGKNFTSRGFRHLANVPSLKTLVSFRIHTITNEGLQYLTDLPNLERLFLHDNAQISNAGLVYLKPMKRLKMLDLGMTKVTEGGLADLKEIKTLERLDIPTRNLTDRGLMWLSELPNLRELRISMPHMVDPTQVKKYYTDKGLEYLAKLENLEDLSIGSIGVTDDGMDDVAKMKNLKRVMLFGCDNMTDIGLGKLTALASLEEIVIMSTPVTIPGLSQLKPLKNLKTIDCRQIRRGDGNLDLAGMTQLEKVQIFLGRKSAIRDEDLAGVKDLTDLYWLQLSPGKLTNAGVAHLAGMTRLERLSLHGSEGLTDEGLKYLKDMKCLGQLTLEGSITDEGLRYLADLPALDFLHIRSRFNITQAAQHRLRQQLPNLGMFQVGPTQ